MNSNKITCGLPGCSITFAKKGRKGFCSDAHKSKAYRRHDKTISDTIGSENDTIVPKNDTIEESVPSKSDTIDRRPGKPSNLVETAFIPSKSAEIVRDLHDSIQALPPQERSSMWDRIGTVFAKCKMARDFGRAK